MPGFFEYDANGDYSGYGVEYLNRVAEHTNWQYEYVAADSWPEALKLLREGKIDILAPAQKTSERQAQFLFPVYAVGSEYGALMALDTNNRLLYEDFETLSNIKIGCVDTLVFREEFFRFAAANKFTPNMIYYKDTDALLSALRVGQVDAVVGNLMILESNMKILAKFAPSRYYFMLNAVDYDILDDFNDALSAIKVQTPNFENELTVKYFPNNAYSPLSKKELDYIKDSEPLNVGMASNRDPLSYIDDSTGQAAGITRDILDEVSRISGLRFNYVALPDSDIDYKYLADNKIELITCVGYNEVNKRFKGLKLSNPYLVTSKVLVGRKGEPFSKDKNLKIAVLAGSNTVKKLIKERYPNFEIVTYSTVKSCIDAVNNGLADVVCQNQYEIDRYLARPQYDNLTVILDESVEEALSVATVLYQDGRGIMAAKLSDPRLISIINKSLARLEVAQVHKLIIGQTVNRVYRLTAGDIVYKYRYFIITLIMAAIFLGFTYWRVESLRRANMAIIKENEKKLLNITNNINGGVIVILPECGFRIVYANSGFLELIGCTREEYEQLLDNCYIAYVHPDDIKLLSNSIVNNLAQRQEHVSIQLRICRCDGSYVAALFNGTVAINADGEIEMYCVIMDISEQNKMMEKLELEQERYNLLLERSDDVIFDYDLVTNAVMLSNKFEQKFGWSLPSKFQWEECAKVWWIHADDRVRFEAVVNEIFDGVFTANGDDDKECVVRMMKSDANVIWCRITFHLMKRNGKAIRIVAKITDIDDEVKEKEHWVQKSKLDSLTGLYNKEAFLEEAGNYLAENPTRNTTIIFIDLDNFKKVNDVLGHLVGDEAIKEASVKLRQAFSGYDLAARFGGDEFCVMVKDIDRDVLADKLNWVVKKMKASYSDEKNTINISSSIGAAMSDDVTTDLRLLMLCADKALYSAKENGKNKAVIYHKGLEPTGYESNR